MPPSGKASLDGQFPDLYEQAQAVRDQSRLLAGQLHAAQLRTQENWQLIQSAWDHTERIRAQRLAAGTEPDRLRRSAYARLQARLSSMPVIEQAKGILMAQYGWSEEQAFDVLRRASQRENTKVRDLAVRIVARAAALPADRQPRSASAAARQDGKSASPVGAGGSRDSYRALA